MTAFSFLLILPPDGGLDDARGDGAGEVLALDPGDCRGVLRGPIAVEAAGDTLISRTDPPELWPDIFFKDPVELSLDRLDIDGAGVTLIRRTDPVDGGLLTWEPRFVMIGADDSEGCFIIG